MGFAPSWIQFVMSCVSTVQFAVLLEGHPSKSFKPSRGLRQGDLISPYLFLFGIRLSNAAPTISHLIFADDTLIFLKALVQNSMNLVHFLNAYCNAFGQRVNFSKSTLYFSSNTPGNMCEEICGVFSMSEVDGPGKYLGLPTIWGRAKLETLLCIKERILLKIQGLKQQLLSQAGREVLIKPVAQAVPQYPMNIFLFPKSVCREIDSLLSNFWWGQSGREKRIH
ncbi:unnamed protein product [Prunus armeniaca]